MYNLTEQEIQELLEMGIDPSSVVSAYDQADFGTFVNNTVGKVKNFVTGTPAINPAAPSQGGTAFSLAGGKGVSAFDEIIPQKQMQRPDQPTQYTMTPSGAPNVSTPAGTPSLMQRLRSGVEEGYNKLEDKYRDKIVDKDGKLKTFKPFQNFGNSVMGGISYAKSINDAAQVQEQNRMANQSPFKEAGNTKEYYNHDFVGENDPLFFLNSRDGAKAEASPMYASDGVPIEAEGGEFYLDPSTGATIPIHGPSHEKGGVKMVAKAGSYIMSDNVKIPGSYVNDMLKKNVLPPKKQYTISDVIRQFPQHFDTKQDAEKLNNKSLDAISKNSFEMNMRKKLANVSKLLAYQQQMNGGHGEDEGPEARYGMEINGGQPLSFDYRADELRVQDMQNTQQPPMADDGVKTTPTAPPTQVGTPASSTAPAPAQNTPLDQPRIDAINQLVSQGRLTQDQGNILKQAKIKPDGSLSIPYSAQAAGIDQSTLAQAASYLGNRYVGFSNVPENVKTIYGQNVNMVPGSKKEEYFDKVSNKTFGSLDEYNKFKQENPKLYEDYGKSLEHYTTQKEYYGDKMNTPEEAVDILNRYNGTKSIDYFVLDPSKVKGADGKPDPEKLDELVKAFNSLQGTGPDGKKQFQYKDKKGNVHTITQNSTPGYEDKFFAGLDPDMAAAYYVYKTYGKAVYDQNKADPNALKNIWGKEAIGLNDEDLKSEAWTSGKFFDANWAKKNEATMPAGLRAALGNDNKFGMDHMDPRYQKVLNLDPEKRITPGYGEMQIEGEMPPEIPEIPKKTPPYKERLPLNLGMLPSPRTQNYLPEYRQERYEPNLISLRSAKNDQTAAMNSMLQQQGANPATMSARQASLYGEAAKNIAGITEQENNANAQILNQAKAQNAQMANQIQGMQQQANHQYVIENAQDLAALDADRYKKLSDLYENQQKVNQYNKTLQFFDDNIDKYDLEMDSNGNVQIKRNANKAVFNSNDAAANLRAMQQTVSPQQPSANQQNTQQQQQQQTTTSSGRYGRKNLK